MNLQKTLMMIIALFVVVSLTDAGRKKPVIPPPDSERGSVGVTLSVWYNRARAEKIFFVKLEDGEDPHRGTKFLESNFSHRYKSDDKKPFLKNTTQVYLLNAEPGRYVAVAARIPSFDGEYEAFLSMEMVSKSEVSVGPGEIVHMGDFYANIAGKKIKREADAAQSHYFQLIYPEAAEEMGAAKAYKRHLSFKRMASTFYRLALRDFINGEDSERYFLGKAVEAFEGEPSWQELIEQQLNQVSE